MRGIASTDVNKAPLAKGVCLRCLEADTKQSRHLVGVESYVFQGEMNLWRKAGQSWDSKLRRA